MTKRHIVLENRGLLSVSGEDRKTFLQGLVSCDVTKAAPDRALYGALLTPQGKFLHDFFLTGMGETLYLEGEAARLDDLRGRLARYRLRSKVGLAVDEGWTVVAAFGPGALEALDLPAQVGVARSFGDGVAFTDPRLATAGARLHLPAESAGAIMADAGFTPASFEDWERHRMGLGLPDGSRDLPVEKAILLENGFEELHGVDFDKGCYMGQELTARTKYRGLVRKRLMPVLIDGPVPEPGTRVLLDDKDAGEMRSATEGLGLALLRLERVRESLEQGRAMTAGRARLTPRRPDWMVLPKEEAKAAVRP